MPKPSGETEQGKQLWQYEVKLLTTAHFFAPESYTIHRLCLESRWAHVPRLFRLELERMRNYDDFDDKFGLISPTNITSEFPTERTWPFFGRPRSVDGKLEGEWEMTKYDFCNMIDRQNSVGYPTERTPDFPNDAPTEVLESWKADIRDDFARRLFKMYEFATHATPPIPVVNGHLFLDDAYDLKDIKQVESKILLKTCGINSWSREKMPTQCGANSRPQNSKLYFKQGLFCETQASLRGCRSSGKSGGNDCAVQTRRNSYSRSYRREHGRRAQRGSKPPANRECQFASTPTFTRFAKHPVPFKDSQRSGSAEGNQRSALGKHPGRRDDFGRQYLGISHQHPHKHGALAHNGNPRRAPIAFVQYRTAIQNHLILRAG